MFATKIDSLDEYDGQSLVIVLGQCQLPDDIDPARVMRFPDASGATLQVLGGVDMRVYQAGITLVVASALVEPNFAMVRLIQKHLLFSYIKYIWFPSQDTVTPDPLGVGGDKGPFANLVYDVNKLQNLPYLMGCPRTKDLEGKLTPMPILLLSPGPSLAEIGPHLKELSKRFLVVCLARSLAFCQQHGVTPDIVVQLDTHGEQQNFYPKEMDFSKSWLFILSLAPAQKYIHRFAGVYWIDTFEPTAFGREDYQLRNSWLSSFISMLGVAELFQSPRVLVAGADLAYRSARYFNEAEDGHIDSESLTPQQEVEGVIGYGEFPVMLNDGSVGQTKAQFLATAYEVESIMTELSGVSKWYNLNRCGILEEAIIPYANATAFFDEPVLNRDVFHSELGANVRSGARAEEKVIQRMMNEQLNTAKLLVREAEILSARGDEQTCRESPLFRAGQIILLLHSIGQPYYFPFSRRVVEKYRELLVSRLLLFRFKGWASMSKPIPVYCYPDEKKALETALTKRFPKANWEFRNTWSDHNEPLENRITAHSLATTLDENPVSLMTRRYEDSADYLLQYLKPEVYLIVEDILESPWPGEAG